MVSLYIEMKVPTALVQDNADFLANALARGILARSCFVMFVCQSRFRNSIIVTLRNFGQSMEESARAHAVQQYRQTPPPGVGEDTKEITKGKRWPRSAAKFYSISFAVLI